MRILKFITLAIGALVLVPLLAGLVWAVYQLATYEQLEDAAHLAAKGEYLQRLSDLPRAAGRPNVIFILFDDLGYGDLGYTGAGGIETPAIDRLARDGVQFTQFYSPAAVCTPARAGYLTGRYPPRAGMPTVVFPSGDWFNAILKLQGVNLRIPAEEITLADMLGAAGYRTAMVGKWHLGDRAPSLPNDMGFQAYFGTLYSNDMTPLALYRDRRVEREAPIDQRRLNEHYGREARAVIESGDERPFFLYLAHNFPHIPLYRPEADVNRSAAGLYGDVVEGLDDLVGSLVDTLEATGQLENTLIVLTSDNGPWWEGSPGGVRGRKGETFEGGMRVPALVHWPAGVPGGRELSGMASGIDLLPTLADWLELPLPQDRIVDGRSLRGMLAGEENSPHELLYFFASEQVLAVRDARFKYHARRPMFYDVAGSPVGITEVHGPWLFDTDLEGEEAWDVSSLYPDAAERLAQALAAKRREMEVNLRGWVD